MCLRYWEPCVTEEHATEPAVIKRVSSDKFWVYREDSETESCVLVRGKGYVLENPLLFLERRIKLDTLGQLWLETTYNAEANVKHAAILINEGGNHKGLGKDEDTVRSTKSPFLSEKLLTLHRRALNKLLLCRYWRSFRVSSTETFDSGSVQHANNH